MNYQELIQTAIIIYLLIRDYKRGKIIHELATHTLKIARKVFNTDYYNYDKKEN